MIITIIIIRRRRINKRKRTCRIVDFDVSADYNVKLKESEKKGKYLDLSRELKKVWNMKVTNIYQCLPPDKAWKKVKCPRAN